MGEGRREIERVINQIIFSSDSMTELGSKDDLVSQHGVCDYSVRIQNSVQDSLTVTIKYSLIGKYFCITIPTTLNYF